MLPSPEPDHLATAIVRMLDDLPGTLGDRIAVVDDLIGRLGLELAAMRAAADRADRAARERAR